MGAKKKPTKKKKHLKKKGAVTIKKNTKGQVVKMTRQAVRYGGCTTVQTHIRVLQDAVKSDSRSEG